MSEKELTAGHRQRLRARFLENGVEALADYELLELLLFQAHPRIDVKPLAKRLLNHFSSFADVISAPPERLVEIDGAGVSTVAALKVVQAAALKLKQADVMHRPVLSSWNALIDYCQAALGFEDREQFRVLFLDKRNRLIADEKQQEGTIDHTPVYPREVAKRALQLGASALILVHNHPSGDPKPSRGDIEMTKQIARAGEALGITLHDHLIIARGQHISFKNLGLL